MYECRRNWPTRMVDGLGLVNSDWPTFDPDTDANEFVRWCGEWKRSNGVELPWMEQV